MGKLFGFALLLLCAPPAKAQTHEVPVAPSGSPRDTNPHTQASAKEARKVVNEFAYRVTRSLGCAHLDQAVQQNGERLWRTTSSGLTAQQAEYILWDYLNEVCGSYRASCYQKLKPHVSELLQIYYKRDIQRAETKADLETELRALHAAIDSVNKSKSYAKIGCRLTEEQALRGVHEGEAELRPVTGFKKPDSFSEGVTETTLQNFVNEVTENIGCSHSAPEVRKSLDQLSAIAEKEFDDERFRRYIWERSRLLCQNKSECARPLYLAIREVARAQLEKKGEAAVESALTKLKGVVEAQGVPCQIPANGTRGVSPGGAGSGAQKPVAPPVPPPSSGHKADDKTSTTPPAEEGKPPAGAPTVPLPRAQSASTVRFTSKSGETTLKLDTPPMPCPADTPAVCFHSAPHGRNALVLDPGHADTSSRNENGVNAGTSGHVHEGQQNMVTALLFRQMILTCLKPDASGRTGVHPETVQLTRWPGETRYGEYEDPEKAAKSGYIIEKANIHLGQRIDELMKHGTAVLNHSAESASNSTMISFHANAGGAGSLVDKDRPEVYYRGENSKTLADNMMSSMLAVHNEETRERVVKPSDYVFARSLLVLKRGNASTHRVLLEPYFMDGSRSLAIQAHNEIAAGKADFIRATITQKRAGATLDTVSVGPSHQNPANGKTERGYFVAPTYKKIVESMFKGFVKTYSCTAGAQP